MNAVVEPSRHKLTVDDFVRMGEAGIFPEDARIELIEGDLIDMPPIGTGHSALTNRLNRLLVRAAGDDAIVSVGNPVVLPPWSMPQPDFLLLGPRVDFYAGAHPRAQDTLLAIEVADSSLRFDRVTKARVYATNGIGEYWLIDVAGRRLHLHRGPQASGSWATLQVLDAPFRISPAALPGLVLSSEDLWPTTAAGR
jgi:Uma2 family endonuclease